MEALSLLPPGPVRLDKVLVTALQVSHPTGLHVAAAHHMRQCLCGERHHGNANMTGDEAELVILSLQQGALACAVPGLVPGGRAMMANCPLILTGRGVGQDATKTP